METRANRHVLAGVNGSEQSLSAVDVGAGEATRRGLPLRLVCAYPQPADDSTVLPAAGVGPPGEEARRRVAAAAARVSGGYPELVVTAAVAAGDLASLLIDESRRADLVVVGDDGRAGFSESVTTKIATHADCPVILARSGAHRTSPGADGPVVVGVKGRGHDAPAIAFALEEAALRGVPLRAVHVWVNIPDMELASVDPFIYDLAEAQRDADRLIDATLAGWSQKYPQVTVERLPIYQVDVAAGLTEAAAGAGLLVLGSRRGNGGRLGPVSRALISHSNCPVAVVHQP
jgi:nucleotide-binding universal stress UspA family protein